jgi:hypothetical protein
MRTSEIRVRVTSDAVALVAGVASPFLAGQSVVDGCVAPMSEQV